MARLTVADTDQRLTAVAAERVTACIEHAIAVHGSAVVSLTGGTTPKRLYEALADRAAPWRARIDWPRVHLFWGDERHVPPDHPDSNYRMTNDALVKHVPIPPSHVHRMQGELADAEHAAVDYEAALRTGFAAAGRRDLTFDLMLLGMGDDAHIASIFPGSPLLAEGVSFMPQRPRVAAVWAPHLNAWRITLTPAAILASQTIVMLVAGETKASAVHAAIEAPLDVVRHPAQLLREAGDRVEWLLDRPAAARLDTPD